MSDRGDGLSTMTNVDVDCDTCTMRGLFCNDCVMSLLLGAPEGPVILDEVERSALGALTAGGLLPPLRLVPLPRSQPERGYGT